MCYWSWRSGQVMPMAYISGAGSPGPRKFWCFGARRDFSTRGSKGKDTLKRVEFLFIRGIPRNADLRNSHNKCCRTIICAWKPEIRIVGFFRRSNARLCDENNEKKPFWYRIFVWLCSPYQYYPLNWKRFLLKGLRSIHHILCVSFFFLLSTCENIAELRRNTKIFYVMDLLDFQMRVVA